MKQETDIYGKVNHIPDNIIEFRGMATGMNLYIERTGMNAQHRAKYDKFDWELVTALIPGNDKVDRSLTCFGMVDLLRHQGITRTPHALYRIIQRMKRPIISVRRINRGHGQRCKEVMLAMGGIQEITISRQETGLLFDITAYHFGVPNSEVIRLRKVFDISAKPE